jgi:O-antigen ligase
MDVNQLLIIGFTTIIILIFAVVNFKKVLYTWILLAGVVGIPLLIVRESRLMLSELFLIPLLFLWAMEKILGHKFIRLPGLSSTKTKIENSMWAMIGAFTISLVYNLVFPDPSVGGEHTFIMGKIMAWFLYVASVLAAFTIADSIGSFDDARRISFLLIILGIFSFIVQYQEEDTLLSFLRIFQKDVGWPWLSVAILFSLSIAYFLFHPKMTKKFQNLVIILILSIQVFSAYFLGTATYKAVLVVNYSIMSTIFYYRSKTMGFLILFISIIIFLSTISIFNYYVEQETQEESWGMHSGSRLSIWHQSLLIFWERPILGIGPYNYYDYSLYMSRKRQGSHEQWGVMTSPHGQYIQILTETGVIGALAFLWFVIELFKLLKYFLNPNFEYKIRIIVSAISAILVSRIIVAIIGDYIIPQYHNGGLQTFCSTVYFWVGLGVLIGLKRVLTIENDKALIQNNY